jgi:hypothetical protein
MSENKKQRGRKAATVDEIRAAWREYRNLCQPDDGLKILIDKNRVAVYRDQDGVADTILSMAGSSFVDSVKAHLVLSANATRLVREAVAPVVEEDSE